MNRIKGFFTKMAFSVASLSLLFAFVPVVAYADTGEFEVKVDMSDDIKSELSGKETLVIECESASRQTATFSIQPKQYTSGGYVEIEEGDYFVSSIIAENDDSGILDKEGYGCMVYFHSSADPEERIRLDVSVGWEATQNLYNTYGNALSVNYNPPVTSNGIVISEGYVDEPDPTYTYVDPNPVSETVEETVEDVETDTTTEEIEDTYEDFQITMPDVDYEDEISDEDVVVEYQDITEEEEEDSGMRPVLRAMGIRLLICACILVAGLIVIYLFHRAGRI